MTSSEVAAYLDLNEQEFIRLSDKIWDYAETAFEEFGSAELIQTNLSNHGFTIEKNIAGIETAFCATYGSGKPVIGILAEFDALSGMSQTAGSAVKEEASPGGNGHGCGHNLFAGGSVAAAVGVKEYLAANKINGTIKLFGCPGEEGGSGKAFMARENVFHDLDVAFAWHPMAFNSIFDVKMLANYQILYKFKGTASHAAAAPHLGRSALDAVELMNVGVNFLREHVIQEARIHYAITDTGGFSPNVVQPVSDVLYLIRAPKTQQVEEIYRRINKIAQGAALMTETEVEIQFIKACANVVPNKTLAAVLYNSFKETELPEYTESELAFAKSFAATLPPSATDYSRFTRMSAAEQQDCMEKLKGKDLCDILLPFREDAPDGLLTASSDVGDVSWNVPTAQIVTACYAIGTPEHSWQLVSQGRTSLGHKGMMTAAKVMARASIQILEHPQIADSAKKEWEQRLEGTPYHCAIPPEVKPRPLSKL